MAKAKNIELLKDYQKKLIQQQETINELTCADLHLSNEPHTPSPETEQVARLADEFNFDGSLFRALRPSDNPLSIQQMKKHRIKIETISKIIAAIERPPDSSIIPADAELLNIPQVANMLNCGSSVIRQRDKAGLLPLPIRIGGTIQWRKHEVLQWLKADCPPREKWEIIKQQRKEL